MMIFLMKKNLAFSPHAQYDNKLSERKKERIESLKFFDYKNVKKLLNLCAMCFISYFNEIFFILFVIIVVVVVVVVVIKLSTSQFVALFYFEQTQKKSS